MSKSLVPVAALALHIVRLYQFPNVVVPRSLVLCHIMYKHMQEAPIKAFTMTIGLRVLSSCGHMLNSQGRTDLGEELRHELWPIV